MGHEGEFRSPSRSVGGRFGYIDDGETANTQVIHFDYGDSELVFEVRGWPSQTPYPGKLSPQTPAKGKNVDVPSRPLSSRRHRQT